MAIKYIVQHRRGCTTQWQSATSKLREGEIGIEYSDDYSMARILIGNKDGYDALAFSAVSKIRTISLPLSAWEGSNGTWSQIVTIDGVTTKSKVDLQPNASQLSSLQDSETSLVTENNEGVVTVYAIGNLPEVDFEMQATITETND